MAEPLTAAEAWCWVEHMLRVESDAAAYEWPRQADSYHRSVELDQQAQVFDAPVQPAEHYDRPMSAAELKRVCELRDCKDACAGICPKCFGWIELRGQESGASEACTCPECPSCAPKKKPRKPTKRRGTKPGSGWPLPVTR